MQQRTQGADERQTDARRVGRRQWLSVVAAAAGLGPVIVWAGSPGHREPRRTFSVTKTDEEWRAALTPPAYRVLRGRGTERSFGSPLHHSTVPGTYACAGCGQRLFSSSTKFDSGTGWPSFWAPLPDAVDTEIDRSWFMVRTAVNCSACDGHLGHVFDDGPAPTGLRYCMNGVALRLVPA
jgi:peptide-methionine (R)-S-oxide reductase